jgi:hypothetical protein
VAALGLVTAGRPAEAQPAGCRHFPQTGKTVCGKFLAYWDTHGGLAQQGYPISEAFQEVSELDNQPYTVQYFERAVFELHPENAPPYDVLLAQLGTYQLRRKYPGGAPGAATPAAGGDAWAALRQRPLRLPTPAAGGACPATAGRIVAPDFAAALGDGPVYPVGLGTDGTLRYVNAGFDGPWAGQKVLWVGDPSYRGRVLIRGRQLDGANEVRFERGADPPAELALDTATATTATSGWANWPSYTRVRASGCYAYQVDGATFTDVIIFKAVPGQ